MKNSKVRFITLTAAFIALLIVFQATTAPLGQLVTGALVNFTLIAACLLAGLPSALCVAIISPVLAKLFGIGPLWPIIPAVALGNIVLVAAYALVFKIKIHKALKWIISIPLAAATKGAVLFVGVTKIILPLINAAPKMVEKLTAMFGITQVITALIGGGIALITVPLINLALEKTRK